jgi:hypothetical protein
MNKSFKQILAIIDDRCLILERRKQELIGRRHYEERESMNLLLEELGSLRVQIVEVGSAGEQDRDPGSKEV